MGLTQVRGGQILNESVDFAQDVSVPVTTLTGGTTLTSSQTVVLCDTTSGAFTVTLPTAVAPSATQVNGPYQIKNIGANALTINTTSAQTIDGNTSLVLSVKNSSVDLVSNNANWFIQ